ncbi:AMIN domain-containing protein [Maridesulfovibrio sp.]|uniref:AMIN domain-containing protein n=1 Tax=Maridesulfovibrio sp. TaxID=2795000 RepID=UPI0029F4BEBD|nr:AMIN domain-containing protein [Maridesulfovibrio sp.]
MKMKFRPFTFLLLILLLLAGIGAASYHMGYFDAFFAEKTDQIRASGGEGPVIRRDVSKLVLPLESAEDRADESGKELNEMEIPAAGSTDAVDLAEQGGNDSEVASSEAGKAATVSKNGTEPVAEPKPRPQPKESARSAASDSTGGELKGVSISCQKIKNVITVAFSGTAGKLSWFNLENPRRLVVDMRGKWKNKAKSLYRVKNCLVKKVVLGEHPDKIRLVVYLDPKKFSAKVKPVVRRLDNAVSVELVP